MTTTENPKIIVSNYGSHGVKTTPPDAARFGRGAGGLAQIREATELRRLHNEKLSDPGRRGWEKQSRCS
jgi:hypothetical protein